MNPNEVNTIIMFHHDLPRANVAFYNGALPTNIHTLIATDGIAHHQITTHLYRNKQGFLGTPKIKSMYLKGITENLAVPSILVPPEDNKVILTLDLGNASFTQVYTRHAPDRDCESVFFGSLFLDALGTRTRLTYLTRQDRSKDRGVLMTPGLIKEILQKASVKLTKKNHEVLFELVTETTNPHVEKLKHSGLILKRTVTIFNKERKSYIEYYVISATGSIRIFEGEHTTFEKEAKTGYVLLTDLPKATS